MKKNAGKWITCDPSLAFTIPALPACYVVYLDGEIKYIGQSTNVRKRLQNYNIRCGYGGGYITPWGYFDNVRVKIKISTKYGDWAMRELRLINRLQPPLNCVGSVKRRQSTNG